MLTPEEKLTQQSYEKIAAARQAKKGDPDFWSAEVERFARQRPPPGRVLDVGCGDGRDAHLLLAAGYDYLGIDLSPAMLRLARTTAPSAKFRRMSLHRLRFSDGTFDGIWAVCSLLHLPKRRVGSVLKEIRRVLRPNGLGFIVVKEGVGEKMVRGDMSGDERYYAYYGQAEFAAQITSAGFVIEEATQQVRGARFLLFYVRPGP